MQNMTIKKRPKTLTLGSFFIIYKCLKDTNNKKKDLKVKIYYLILKTISHYTYHSFSFINFKKIRY